MSQAKNIFLFFITEEDACTRNLLTLSFHFWISFGGGWGEKRGLPVAASGFFGLGASQT